MQENEILISTAYCPNIEYFRCITSAQKIIIEQYESFPKQTFRNRCTIYSANGVLSLYVPLHKNNGEKTSDVRIAYTESWMLKHWRAIESAYNSSPYFLYYKDEFRDILFKKYERLLDLNTEILHFLLKKLKLNKDIQFSADFRKPQDEVFDFRYRFSPKTEPQGCFKEYYQVFEEKSGFQPNLSMLDLLFNEGPQAIHFV